MLPATGAVTLPVAVSTPSLEGETSNSTRPWERNKRARPRSAASHYLKTIMDGIFGRANFLNEIIWKRTTTKSDFAQGAKNWPRIHDTVLYYAKDQRSLSVDQFN
jgi:hypothetical protein